MLAELLDRGEVSGNGQVIAGHIREVSEDGGG